MSFISETFKWTMVEPMLVEFWASWTHWSYAQFIFAGQESLSKVTTMARWS